MYDDTIESVNDLYEVARLEASQYIIDMLSNEAQAEIDLIDHATALSLEEIEKLKRFF